MLDEVPPGRKERWLCETSCSAVKTIGCKREETQQHEPERNEILFAFVLVAFTWAYLVGD
jgi:hypothetical protein